jgi:hypothetical protein
MIWRKKRSDALSVRTYAQFYDFPVLLIAVFGLVGNREPSWPVFGLMLALLVLPYLNLFALVIAGWPPCTFAWVPATLAIAWLAKARESGAALIDEPSSE